MIKYHVDLSNVERGINDRIDDIIEEKVTDLFIELTDAPPIGTPVKSGQARAGWQLDMSDRRHPVIWNPIVYILKLIDGSSKQSPKGWFENAIDKVFRR